jgi:hypothetical protein
MKTCALLLSLLMIAGCVPGDCVKDCYLINLQDMDLQHKCDMDPNRHDCPKVR